MDAIVQRLRARARRGLGALLLAGLVALGVGAEASADTWQALPERAEKAAIEGQAVTFLVHSQARFTDRPGGGIDFDLRADSRLDDLQAKSSAILTALAANKSNCDTRWTFPSLAPAIVQGGKLRVSGAVRLEKWLCAGGLKTRLASQAADFTMAMSPVRRDNELAIAATLEKFSLDNGALAGIEEEVKQWLASSLNDVFDRDDMKVRFPPELAAMRAKFTDAHLVDRDNGIGELHVAASAVITAADMPKILKLLAH